MTDPGSNPGGGTFLHAKEPHWRNWIAHQTSNLGVEGSNPSWGAHFCMHRKAMEGLGPVRLVWARAALTASKMRGYGAMAARRIPDPKAGGSNPSGFS